MPLVGLPEGFQALKLLVLACIWYVGTVQAAPLGLEAEDLREVVNILSTCHKVQGATPHSN